MFDDMARKMAYVLTEYSQPVNPGDYVVISANTEAMPLVEALHDAVLARGGKPAIQLGVPGLTERRLALGNDDQIAWVDPASVYAIEHCDIYYGFQPKLYPKELAALPAERVARYQKGLQAWYDVYRRRFGAGELRWTGSLWPTMTGAHQANMGLRAYTEFVYKACALDQDDPAEHWRGVRAQQDKLCNWLNGKSHCKVTGPGIELEFDFTDRLWINAHGDLNFPDGEIYTGPVEDSVNGHVHFNFPTAHGGREMSGIKLRYENGVVVEASAEKDEAFFLETINQDEGARRMGEFAIGTNMGIQQFTGNTLFDEKIGGTIHMALGFSVPNTRGVNQSIVHWDMVHDMKDGGEITIDGELFYKNGQFVIEG